MGFLYLAVAKLTAIVKMTAMKGCGDKENGLTNSIFVNTLRSFLCLVVSAVVLLFNRKVTGEYSWLWLLSGLSNALNMFTWILCATAVSLSLVEVVSMIGSVFIPLALAPCLYAGETVSILQWCGCGVLLVSVIIFSLGDKTKRPRPVTWALLVLCALSLVGANVTQKLYVYHVGSEYTAYFNAMTFAVVFACFIIGSLILFLIRRTKRVQTETFFLSKRTYILISVAAVTMYASQYFNTLAAALLASAVLYPLSYGSGFLLTALTDAVVFKEKPTVKRIIATALALGGVIMTVI